MKKDVVLIGFFILVSVLIASAINWNTDGNITLLTLLNDSIVFDFNKTYEFTGNASTQGASLVNLSLYHNFNGTWLLNQSEFFETIPSPVNESSGSLNFDNSEAQVVRGVVINSSIKLGIKAVYGRHTTVANPRNFTNVNISTEGAVVLGTATVVPMSTGQTAQGSPFKAVFTTPVQLEADTSYRLYAFNNTGSADALFDTGASNIVLGNITFAQGSNQDTNLGVGLWVFEVIEIQAPNSTDSFNWSFNTSLPFGRDFFWNVEGCASDNTCGQDSGNFTLHRDLFLRAETFNNATTSGNEEFFEVNISMIGKTLIAANISYNNTNTSGTISSNEENYSISTTLVIPVTNTSVNKTFFWDLLFDDATRVSTPSNNQTLTNIRIDDCSTFTTIISNFTVLDEEFQTFVVGAQIQGAINIFTKDRSVQLFEFATNSSNPLIFCLENNITTELFSLDTVVKYEKNNVYAVEYHNILNQSLNDSSIGKNISLFDLNLTDSTEFQTTFFGANHLPVEGALIFVERQYIPENVFKVVELPITDPSGRTVLHLVRNDIIYNMRVVKDGAVIGNFPNIIAFCQDFSIGDCTLNLNAASSDDTEFEFNELTGILFTPPTFNNNTKAVSFTFISANGLSKTVEMNVTRNDAFGNRSLCSISLTSPSGTIECSVGGIGDTLLIATITVDSITALISPIRINESDFGSLGYVVWFILTLGMVLMFGESKSGVLIGILGSYIGAIVLGINRGSIVGLGSAGVWVITITALGIWRLNRDRQQ